MDVELLEERLVELAPEFGRGVLVELVAALDEGQTAGQSLSDLLEGQIGAGQLGLGTFDLSRDAVLFGLEEVEGHGVGVVGVEQLLPLARELLQPTTGDALAVLGATAQVFEILAEQGVQQIGVLRMQSQYAVLSLNLLLDLVDPDVAPNAVGALLMATDAEEVLVSRAVTVGLLVEAESAAAGAAEDGAAQVVREPSVLLAGAVGVEDGLDFVEQRRFDERFVVAGVLNALPVDEADVVVIAQHPLQRRTGQRPFWQ